MTRARVCPSSTISLYSTTVPRQNYSPKLLLSAQVTSTERSLTVKVSTKMDTPYYNLIPPLAQSEDFEPLSPGGSDDSGVQDEQPPKPQRPPRSIDTPSKLPKHSYINLGHPDATNNTTENNSEPPPSLPKRQPYLVNPRSPALTNRSTSSTRSSLFRQKRGICKCKTATSGKFSALFFYKIDFYGQQGGWVG